MILTRVDSPTTLKMLTAQDAVGDVVDVAEVRAVAVAMAVLVDMAVVPNLAVVQIQLETPTLHRVALTCRLTGTPMMMCSFCRIA